MRSFAIATLLSAACAVNAATITVKVGQSGFTYTPSNFNASAGDVVVFDFVASGTPHAASQSSFNAPCTPLSGGFDSGQMTGSSSSPPTFNYTVTSTDPVYFHCTVPTHCQSGMVGAINAGQTFAAFQTGATTNTTPSGASAGSSAAATGTGASASTGTASGSGTSAETATASSAARQIGGGSAFGAAMALLVGLAL